MGEVTIELTLLREQKTGDHVVKVTGILIIICKGMLEIIANQNVAEI